MPPAQLVHRVCKAKSGRWARLALRAQLVRLAHKARRVSPVSMVLPVQQDLRALQVHRVRPALLA